MYYIIKKQSNVPLSHFVGFSTTKYFAKSGSDKIICDVIVNDKKTKSWILKSDIILLTEDRDFFIKTMDRLKELEMSQKESVMKAKENLEKKMQEMTKSMNDELEQLKEMRSSKDKPCILSALT